MAGLTDYWESLRDMYWPFESGLKASTADVYRHEIPGGQYSNLRPRAIQLGLGHRWNEIKDRYTEVNRALGHLIKVTPTSKVVADFSMFLVQNNLDIESCIERSEQLDFPQSLIDFMSGRLGQPYGGFPQRLQNAVLKGQTPLTDRAGAHMPPHDFSKASEALRKVLRREPKPTELVTDALYPKVFSEYNEFQQEFGEISHLPTPSLLYGLEIGEQILVQIESGKRS